MMPQKSSILELSTSEEFQGELHENSVPISGTNRKLPGQLKCREKSIKTVTLGCRLNFYESEILKASLSKEFLDDEVIIINTCAVTHEADRQSKQMVRKCIRENPGAKIFVTGCSVHTENEYFSGLPGIHRIINNDMKKDYSFDQESLFDGKARAFLQIQNGCDNYCTFCIVPYTRGRSVSLPIDSILQKVRSFIDAGLKEIVFSGIDITSYGKDLAEKTELADVLIRVLKDFPDLDRIRISSLDPHGITGKLLDLIIHEQRILPHLHLSIQSGDDHILRLMKRRHTREEVIKLCNSIKEQRNDMVLGSDFIAGFPGETEEMFMNTMDLVDEAHIEMLHVFPYSRRAGTVASNFIQLPHDVVHERAKRLREKGEQAYKDLLSSFIGKHDNFIVEKIKDGTVYGKTDHFIPIKTTDTNIHEGTIVKDAGINDSDNEFLYTSK